MATVNYNPPSSSTTTTWTEIFPDPPPSPSIVAAHGVRSARLNHSVELRTFFTRPRLRIMRGRAGLGFLESLGRVLLVSFIKNLMWWMEWHSLASRDPFMRWEPEMEFESGNKKPAVFAETLNIITHFNTLLLLLKLAGKANTEVFVLPAMTGVVWSGGVVEWWTLFQYRVTGVESHWSLSCFLSKHFSSLNPILAVTADGWWV